MLTYLVFPNLDLLGVNMCPETLTDYCPGCFKVVAPADPERVTRKGKAWHWNCLRKHRRVTTEELQKRLAIVRARRETWIQPKTVGDWGDECT